MCMFMQGVKQPVCLIAIYNSHMTLWDVDQSDCHCKGIVPSLMHDDSYYKSEGASTSLRL